MRIFLAFALAAVTVLVWSESIVLSKNYLLNNPNWVVGKHMSVGPITGGSQTVTSRSVIAGYEMNFASYFAFQELNSRRPEAIDRLDLRIYLSNGALFDIFYFDRDGERAGLRLSNNPAFPGRVYRLKDYRFTWSQLQPELELNPGWYDISIRPEGGGLWIFIDGKPRLALPESQLSAGFGLRSGKEKVILSKVETYLGGQRVWEDGFRQSGIWLEAAQRSSLFLAILLLAILIATRSWRVVESTVHYALAFGVLWFTFDYFYYSYLPTSRTREGSALIHPTVSYFNFESLRHRIFEKILSLPGDNNFDLLGLPPYPPLIIDLHPLFCVNQDCAIGEIDHQFPPKAPHEKRLLMLGGSMLRGQGVIKEENIFFYQIARLTQQTLNAGHFTALNLARSDEIEGQVRLFLERYQRFEPDLLVVSILGIWNQSQENALRQLAEYCRDHRIQLLYLVAPMNREFGNGPTSGIEMLTKDYGVQALDLDEAFADELHNNTGIPWWDSTHLTDYGNRLIFEYSRPFMERNLAALTNPSSAAHGETRKD